MLGRIYDQFTLICKKENELDKAEGEYQFHVFTDSLLDNDSYSNPKVIRLMNCNKRMRCPKVKYVVEYYVPNRYKFPEKYAHLLLFLFSPFRTEEELLSRNIQIALGHLRPEFFKFQKKRFNTLKKLTYKKHYPLMP